MSVFTAAGGAADAGPEPPEPPEPSAAPLPREDAAPETPGLGEHQGSAGPAAAEGLRGSREWDGGLQPEPFAVVPPPPGLFLALGPCLALHGMGLGKWLLSGVVSAPGHGCPALEEVFRLALGRERPAADCIEHPVQSMLRPWGSCCLCLGFAVPMARGKLLPPASPCEAFPSFCLPADVFRLSCSLGLAGAYCHCACDPSTVWSH